MTVADNTQLLEDAHRTAVQLDDVAAELNGLVSELRTLLTQLDEVEEKRQSG